MSAATRDLVVTCPTCAARPDSACQSRTGLTRTTTHLSRFRAALHGDPVRQWFLEKTEWRRAA